MKLMVYPGTFDPPTHGHINLVERAAVLTDRLIVAIAEDSPKLSLLSLQVRLDLMRRECEQVANVDVVSFKGLLVQFMDRISASVIVRGLRMMSDFDHEFQLASVNAALSRKIETVFIPTLAEHRHISSSVVREILRLGGDVSSFVSPTTLEALR